LNCRNFLLPLALVTMCGSGVLTAQPRDAHPWWITLGGGAATVTDGSATMALGAVYGQLRESSLISARILGATNDNPTVRRLDPRQTTYRLTDYGILYGPAWSGDAGYVSVGAGIGMVRATTENGTSSLLKSTISLPLEAQAFWQIYGSFGLGVYAFSSINNARTFSGVIVAVQLGVLAPQF
jgi:hypothetical protein